MNLIKLHVLENMTCVVDFDKVICFYQILTGQTAIEFETKVVQFRKPKKGSDAKTLIVEESYFEVCKMLSEKIINNDTPEKFR